MPAPGTVSTFDGNPNTSPPVTSPYRPGTADFNGLSLQDDAVYPPDPTRMVVANLANAWSAFAMVFGRLCQSLTISVAFAGVAGYPSLDSETASPTAVAVPGTFPGTTAPWLASTSYALNSYVIPTVANGFYYQATSVSGTHTSGASEPTWPTTIGLTVTDNAGANQIVWTCSGVTPGTITIARTNGGAAHGDITITWPANTFPASLTKPKGATLNTNLGAHSYSIGVTAISNGMRVTTNQDTTPTDIPFTVELM